MERLTRQRRAILEVLTSSDRPLSPAEITERAAENVASISLVTVYRNLKTLCENGAIVAVELVGRPPRYEAAGLSHHHHFLCVDCDRVFDIQGCRLGSLRDMLPKGFEVQHHEVQLSGRCKDCRD
ncbi:MAG: transcriptional repressor [Planctomycetes bacterium]|nr:transcriptional repressor [Planctomycetota bacterium]